jgi:flavin reductase (DIM6/NTAB) family NADH-FMN oxidoreductase RutF
LPYIDIASADWREVYKLCIGFINPRPIALVSSASAAGEPNLAPFSFYNMVCANPPVVMFCPGFKRDGGQKDTLLNVRETGEFVVATATESTAEGMNACSAGLARGQSEWTLSGLTPRPAAKVRPALVAESPVNIECTLRDIHVIAEGPGGSSVVFGEITAMHVADWALDGTGAVDPRRISTIGRLGGLSYCNTRDEFPLPRPG